MKIGIEFIDKYMLLDNENNQNNFDDNYEIAEYILNSAMETLEVERQRLQEKRIKEKAIKIKKLGVHPLTRRDKKN